MKTVIFDIPLEPLSNAYILEKIKKYISQPAGFFHIVSLNPENIILSEKDKVFKKVLQGAQIKLIDGVGVDLACRLLKRPLGERVAGVNLMEHLIDLAHQRRLRVVFIGGRANVAEKVVDCQKRVYPNGEFLAFEGIKDIANPKAEEEQKIFSIVTDFKPHILFIAFGSPFQELWIDRHHNQLSGIVCMGVGGGFDYLAGEVRRAPLFIRRAGFEWLFRLVVQPWRIWRQRRLLQFVYLTAKELLRSR